MTPENTALFASMIGALVGGGFALLGQGLASRGERRRASTAREHAIADLRRAEAIGDARELLALFVGLSAHIAEAPDAARNNARGVPDWRPEWAAILTTNLYERMSALNMVLPPLELRKAVGGTLVYLRTAATLAAESDESFRTEWPLRWIAERLSSNGERLMAAYIRGDELRPDDTAQPYWAALDDSWNRMLASPTGRS